MIIYRYQSSWEAELINSKTSSHPTQNASVIKDLSSDYFLTWSEFISFSKENKNNISLPAYDNETDIVKHTPRVAQHIIEKIMDNYDADDCIFGLFSALTLSQAKSRISPFIATHNYCVTILSCTAAGVIKFNVSPIYHLGPEYPEQYRLQHGTALDENAIIGLTQIPVKDPYNLGPFSLGIDAGIVFKESTIPHNKLMTLALEAVENGLMANLSCETQTTSRKFTWNFLGLEVSTLPSNGDTAHKKTKNAF